MRTKLFVVAFACFVLGWLAGQRPNVFADPPMKAAAPTAPPFLMSARVGANLYMATSAEYRACCHTIYRCAADRLEAMLKANKYDFPAVIMDLDETVVDNGAFATFLHRNNLEYSDELWHTYEASHQQDLELVPGALEFIKRAEARGVMVLFVSNRMEANKNATAAALQRLKVGRAQMPAEVQLRDLEQRLYLKGASSEKATRRETIAAKYNVVMMFGDSLRDFSEAFAAKKLTGPEECAAAIRERNLQADHAVAHWGVDWFALPNPSYGEWEKLLLGDAQSYLRSTSMKK